MAGGLSGIVRTEEARPIPRTLTASEAAASLIPGERIEAIATAHAQTRNAWANSMYRSSTIGRPAAAETMRPSTQGAAACSAKNRPERPPPNAAAPRDAATSTATSGANAPPSLPVAHRATPASRSVAESDGIQ